MLTDFLNIPPAKIYKEEMTPEQQVTFKLVHGQKISEEDEAILQEAIEFYELAYPALKSIDLSSITDDEALEVMKFMKSVFNMEIMVQNKITFEDSYRVSFLKDAFLEKDKVRNLGFLKHPPVEVNKAQGVYGRANSPNSTLFYCASHPDVAILETKPKVGDRIIIGHWKHDPKEKFVTYPLMNEKHVKTEELLKARSKFEERMTYNHPLFAKIMDLLLEFICSEFVKDSPVVSPKRYEYLYSAYFADQILDNSFEPVPHPVEELAHYDALIYPSITSKYETENLAVLPESVKKLIPYQFIDCIVVSEDASELDGDRIPVTVKVLRRSYWIENELIIWKDD